jgi:hypothetical protein
MRLREFIALVGGAAAAWPLGARAQQTGDKVARIGYLGVAPRPPDEAFRQELRKLGYRDGKKPSHRTPLGRE